MKKKGFFITFEGAEGSGKSTQIRKTALLLKRMGFRVVLLREPGGTKVSEKIREILLDRKNSGMTARAELLLYLAARAQIVEEKIAPALRAGKVVICDRFEDSTLAYQGFGRGISLDAIREASRTLVRQNLAPDLTILLDLKPEAGFARGGRHDRMERQPLAFHRRVRNGYLKLAREKPRRYLVVDARVPIEQVFAEIKKRIGRVLGKP